MLPEPNASDFRSHLAIFEGREPHMYLDDAKPRGNVTTGIGHMIPNADAAVSLPFTGGDPREDWGIVKSSVPDMSASKYAPMTTCRLSPEAIDALCDADTAQKFAEMERAVPEIAGYPPNVVQAMLDMAFNLGVAGLLKFRKMLAAMQVGDWPTAAKESLRSQLAKSRNDYTAQLILSAQEPVIS
jgi:GH24 family phage-related lysozyme (muramidase)